MKENKRKCVKCGVSKYENPDVILHRFPKPGKTNIDRCVLWAKYCYPQGSWSSLKFLSELHSEHRMLCGRHFKKTWFIDTAGTKLFKAAVPYADCDKVLTDASTSLSQPLMQNINIINQGQMTVDDTTSESLNTQKPKEDGKHNLVLTDAGPSLSQPLMQNINIINQGQMTVDDTTSESLNTQKPKEDRKQNLLYPVFNTFEPEAGPSQPLLQDAHILNQIQADVDYKHKGPLVIQEQQGQDIRQKKMLIKLKKNIRKVYHLQDTVKKLKNKPYINELASSEAVKNMIKLKISPTAALLVQEELKNYKRKKFARRWDMDCKIVALQLYKRSPTCYRLLRKMICLPAPSTLKFLLGKFEFGVGINKKVFEIIKKKALKTKKSDNEYVLMWDEMSIKKNLTYNPRDDCIEGYQDHAAHGRSSQVASYALVFMIAGVRKTVKQPVAFYLSAGSVTADRLSVVVKEVLKHCFDCGLNICATVCDMDGVNRRALGILGATVEHPVTTIANKEVVTIFDTPHLLKCFRNMFMKHDIQCQTDITSDNRSGIGIAKWAYIKEFYHLDNNNPNFVFAPCLKKEHLDPNNKQKMKVKLAAQVLSHSVAAGMYAKISQGELPAEAITTANVLSNMDMLFDSVNASTTDLRRGKPLSTNLKNNTKHLKLFASMKEFFKNLKFLGARRAPPSQEGWVWTLNGLELIWKNLTLKHNDIKSLATRRLQQDPLENLFGCIRSNCGANTNPTAGQFVAGLKTAVLSNLSHMVTGNCENDENDVIISNYKTLFAPITDVRTDDNYNRDIDMHKEINYACEESMRESDTGEIQADTGDIQACAYVCGYIIKNNNNIKSCESCKKNFVSEIQLAEHIFIDFKQYDSVKRSLMYATKEFIMCVEESATIINKFLENEAHKKSLRENISSILHTSMKYSFLDKCAAHKQLNLEYIIRSVFYICIKRFCILRNRQFTEEYSRASLKKKIKILQHQ